MSRIIDLNKITAGFTSPFPLNFDEVRESVSDLGFTRPADGMVRAKMSESGQAIPLGRLVKDSIEIIYDEQRGFLSLESGEEIDQLSELIEPVFQRTLRLSSLTASIKWYEANFTCRKLGKEYPLVAMTKSSKATDLFKKASSLEPHFFSRSFCSFPNEPPDQPLKQVENWVHITVGAFVHNPRYYQMNFICRRADLDEVVRFYRLIPSMIEEYSNPDMWRE